MKTAIDKARETVIDQAKLLVRQQATIDDVAIAVDRLEALEANPVAAEELEQPKNVPFKVVSRGIPVTKCIVDFSGGVKIGVWVMHGFTTHAIKAARIEYKKLFDEDAPSIKNITKPKNHIAHMVDFEAKAITIPYEAEDGTPEKLIYILDNRHKD